jgi:hypothetical protein
MSYSIHKRARVCVCVCGSCSLVLYLSLSSLFKQFRITNIQYVRADCLHWPTRSPDISLLYFYLWSHFQIVVRLRVVTKVAGGQWWTGNAYELILYKREIFLTACANPYWNEVLPGWPHHFKLGWICCHIGTMWHWEQRFWNMHFPKKIFKDTFYTPPSKIYLDIIKTQIIQGPTFRQPSFAVWDHSMPLKCGLIQKHPIYFFE